MFLSSDQQIQFYIETLKMEFEDYREPDKLDIRSAFVGRSPEDPPLLEDLGIDLKIIKKESYLIFKVLHKTPVDFSFVKNADLSGPIIFVAVYALGLVLNRKVHFGYIYFISLITTLFTYFLLNVLDTKHIRFVECCSVLGYSFLPMVFFSFLSIFIGRIGTGLKMLCGLVFAGWSGYTASVVFCQYLSLADKSLVLGYPLMLAYIGFTMIAIF